MVGAAPRGGPPDAAGASTSPTPVVAGPIVVATATFGITSLIVMFALALLPTAAFGWTATVIESSSMQPTIVRGDIVILRPLDQPAEVGDVIRFPADDGGTSIVHRVVAVDTGAAAYVTKGDANRSDDGALVPFADVDGVATMLVPLIGHPSLWIREGQYLLAAAAALACLGVIWGGSAVSGRPPDGTTSNESGQAPIVPDEPLGRWWANPADHRRGPSTAPGTSRDRPPPHSLDLT